MSRAEARLNSADTTEALVNERAALRALQRAFDRRRYLLRTLPNARASTCHGGCRGTSIQRARPRSRRAPRTRIRFSIAHGMCCASSARPEPRSMRRRSRPASSGWIQRLKNSQKPPCKWLPRATLRPSPALSMRHSAWLPRTCDHISPRPCRLPSTGIRSPGGWRRNFRIPAMMVENGLRVLALAIAIAAFVDPRSLAACRSGKPLGSSRCTPTMSCMPSGFSVACLRITT